MVYKAILLPIFILNLATCDPSGTSQLEYPSIQPTLKISIFGEKTVTLPHEEVILKTNVTIPENVASSSPVFTWDVLEGDGLMEASAYDKPELIMRKLKTGLLLVRVTISYGDLTANAEHSLKIMSPLKETNPPKAIIRPSGVIETVEGSIVMLDAEGSSISASPASFEWTQVSGPSVTFDATNVAILKIDSIPIGNFTFKVTVTDSEKRRDSASVDVIVVAERDDHPKAVISECGTDSKTGTLTVRLPLEKLVLCGNTSTDDKGIVSYRWFRIDKLVQQIAVDLAGTQTSTLVLTNLQANEKIGPYQFKLDVTDAKGQNDTATVSVFVNEARNLAPVADAGGNRTVLLPENSAILEGNAKDDGLITGYKWQQESGPINVTLVNSDQAKATVSDLIQGAYTFRFTVVDDGGLNGTDVAYLEVKKGQNLPPKIVVNNVSISLPLSIALLDASKSHDDAGIVYWKWTPMEDVPASLVILGSSDRDNILQLSALSSGIFRFNLTVKDQQGERDEQIVWLHVSNGPAELESVEMFLTGSLDEFTVLQRAKLENRMSSVLASDLPDASSVLTHVTHVDKVASNGHTRLTFWAEVRKQQESIMKRDIPPAENILRAVEIVRNLKAENRMHADFGIERIETLYCKLDCSHHGICSDFSKECTCDRFWMSSLMGILFNGGKHLDCAWSSVYFVISLILLGLLISIYFFAKINSPLFRRKGRRLRRRRRYSPLHSEESDQGNIRNSRRETKLNRQAPRLQPLLVPLSSDSLHSESDDLLPPMKSDWQNIELRERDSTKKSIAKK